MIGTSSSDPMAGGFIEPETAADESRESTRPSLSSRQEGKLIHYLDQKLLEVSRLYKRRAVEDSVQAVAASALDQLLLELSSIVKILEQVPAGSASIVVAYALNILDIASDYIRVFDRSPTSTFVFTRELDGLFVSLLDRRLVNLTEQTRLNGLVSRLRNIVYTKYDGRQEYEARCSSVFEGSMAFI